MEFCDECHNLMRAREAPDRKTLEYWCPECDLSRPANSNLVYTNQIATVTPESLIRKEYALDPTLSRPKGDKKRCPKCGHNEVVYFTVSDENIEIVFLCCNQNCAHQWKEDVQTAAPAPRAAAS